jgi:hypothetical protein
MDAVATELAALSAPIVLIPNYRRDGGGCLSSGRGRDQFSPNGAVAPRWI